MSARVCTWQYLCAHFRFAQGRGIPLPNHSVQREALSHGPAGGHPVVRGQVKGHQDGEWEEVHEVSQGCPKACTVP